MAEKMALVPVRVLERVYRAVIAQPQPLGQELAEAIEEFYKAIGNAPTTEADA